MIATNTWIISRWKKKRLDSEVESKSIKLIMVVINSTSEYSVYGKRREVGITYIEMNNTYKDALKERERERHWVCEPDLHGSCRNKKGSGWLLLIKRQRKYTKTRDLIRQIWTEVKQNIWWTNVTFSCVPPKNKRRQHLSEYNLLYNDRGALVAPSLLIYSLLFILLSPSLILQQ